MIAIDKVHVEVAVVLGTTQLPIREVLKMGRGATVPLDTDCDALSELHANGLVVARGRVLVTTERLSFEITELVSPSA